jgi:hypothetical protein
MEPKRPTTTPNPPPEATEQPLAPKKKPYHTPQLRHLGSIRDVTLGGTHGRPELVGSRRRSG